MVDDFEFAAKRFSKDRASRVTGGRSNNRGRVVTTLNNANKTTSSTSSLSIRGRVVLSEKARVEADERRKEQDRLVEYKQRQKIIIEQQNQFFQNYENNTLGIQQLSRTGIPLQLQATSIYGDGDKIALPSSILELLTSSDFDSKSYSNTASSSPWYFRIAIPNPDYTTYPASAIIQEHFSQMKNDDDDDDDMDIDDDDDDDDDPNSNSNSKTKLYREMYLDELKYKYLAYTHGTVVEFTQEEGYVGLPKPICDALLSINNTSADDTIKTNKIPVTRTVDPAATATATATMSVIENIDTSDDDMEHDTTATTSIQHQQQHSTSDVSRTPGHIAYGEFDIPDLLIEITSLKKLPKGTGCTVVPDVDAIQKGFYRLQDIKYVLEQSLQRTRATISIGDIIPTWHRGIQYNLHVESVQPATTYNSISCINTDIEIEFGQQQQQQQQKQQQQQSTVANETEQTISSSIPSSVGYTLGGRVANTSLKTDAIATAVNSNTLSTVSTSNNNNNTNKPLDVDLIAEPPLDQKNNVVTIQLRNGGSVGANTNNRRRFDVTIATLSDLFQYAESTLSTTNTTSTATTTTTTTALSSNSSINNKTVINFQLVTRFPRRVFTLTDDNSNQTLIEVGIQAGQELFLIELLD